MGGGAVDMVWSKRGLGRGCSAWLGQRGRSIGRKPGQAMDLNHSRKFNSPWFKRAAPNAPCRFVQHSASHSSSVAGLTLDWKTGGTIRTVLVGLCLLAAGIVPLSWSAAKSKEDMKMEHQRRVSRFIKADALPPSPGYSQVVEVRPGRIIYIAGQVSLDRAGKLVGEGDMRAQAQQAL